MESLAKEIVWTTRAGVWPSPLTHFEWRPRSSFWGDTLENRPNIGSTGLLVTLHLITGHSLPGYL